MLPDDFAAAQRRHVVRAEGRYHAFLPPPLPPAMKLQGELALQLSAAAQNVDKLVTAGILVEALSRGRTRQFVAREIVRVVEGLPLH